MDKIDNEEEALVAKTTKGFLWLGSSQAFQAILQVIILAILARLITPEGFGIAQAALIVAGFANLISQMGIGPALVQRKEISSMHLRVGFSVSFILGIVLGCITFSSAGQIASFFGMPDLENVVKVISVLFVIESFVVVSVSLLQKKMRLKEYAAVNIISFIIGYGVIGIILGIFNYGYWALIIAPISQSVFKAIIVTFLEPHSYLLSLNKKELRELLYFGSGLTIARFSNYIASQGDNIVVGKFLGADLLGIYSRAYTIMAQPAKLLGAALDTALFPAMATVQDKKSRIISAYKMGISSIAFISFPLACFIVLLSPEIVMLLLGRDWTEAIIPLQILAAALPFRIGYKISDTLARALGAVYRSAMRQLIFAFTVFLGAYVGAVWGLNGVSFGVVIALIIHYFLMAQLSCKVISLPFSQFLIIHLNGIINAIPITIATLLSLALIRNVTNINILTLSFSATISSAIFTIFIFNYPKCFITKESKWIISHSKAAIKISHDWIKSKI